MTARGGIFRALGVLIALQVGGCSCGEEGAALLVDLRTDLVPDIEFQLVRVEVFAGPTATGDPVFTEDAAVLAIYDYYTGRRVAELESVARGPAMIRVRLLDAGGELVAERLVRVDLAGRLLVTVLITRDCRDVMCPQAGDSPAAVTCLGGRCVDPRCIEARTPECAPECERDVDCEEVAPCATPRCVLGVCLAQPDETSCGPGQYCDPEVGCRLRPGSDGGPEVDAGRDAGSDGGPECPGGCDDEVACTVDTCVDGFCEYTPDATLCPECEGRSCHPVEGCQCSTCVVGSTCVPTPGACEEVRCEGEMCVREPACTGDDVCCGRGCAECCGDGDCDDGEACNGVETCAEGACAPGTPVSCDDGVACTVDSCGLGSCMYVPTDALCTAAPGGTCNPVLGCQYPTCTPATCADDPMICETAMCMGEMCRRASRCTAGQVCCAGECVAPGCDDMNPCTNDSCEPTGCMHVNNTSPCSDGNVCTMPDRCAGGACVGMGMLSCDDGNVCTTDSCVPATGCRHEPNMGACDDGDACTTGDRCTPGGCFGGGSLACIDDGNVCTVDECDPRTGLCGLPAGDGTPCSDGSVCTMGDHCEGTECVASVLLSCPSICQTCHPVTGCGPVADGTSCGPMIGQTCQRGTCVDCSPCPLPSCDAGGSPGCMSGMSCLPCASGSV